MKTLNDYIENSNVEILSHSESISLFGGEPFLVQFGRFLHQTFCVNHESSIGNPKRGEYPTGVPQE